LGLLVGILPARAIDADDAVKKELAVFAGEWKIVSRTHDGTVTPAETIKDRIMTFKEASYTIRDGDEIYVSATVKLDPSKDPKWFDLTITTDDSESKGRLEMID
jgi:uncharacterized protein (TIGR03067 family)